MHEARAVPLRPARLLWILLGVFGAQGARAMAQDEGRLPFEGRSTFELAGFEAPWIEARRAGRAAQDVYALAVQAVGDVAGRTVADIGAGRGRHLAGLTQAVGGEGRLLATEITEAACANLRSVAEGAGLTNASVHLGSKTDVGLEEGAVDVALLSDVYQFVTLLDGRGGQDRHAFLTSLHRVLAPGGEVVVTYVTSDRLKQQSTRDDLVERTRRDFRDYGFELGRRWILDGPHWPVVVLEFRSPQGGPAPLREYMGREIARTMHSSGAGWLVRPERDEEEHSTRMLELLGVEPGQAVADFGCGNGYHTLDLARAVGSEGRVFGVDIQPEMLVMLGTRAAEAGLANVKPLLGSALSAPLPAASCDLILLADVYHEVSHPVATLALLRRALKPDGRLAVLEFRAEDPEVPIKREHKMSRAQIVLEFESGGFELAGEEDELPRQHLLFFRAAER